MHALQQIGLVALGGASGSVLRFGLTTGAVALGAQPLVGTLAANIVGCLAGGVLLGAVASLHTADNPWRLLLITGLLGGLTTFSAFGLETAALFRDAKPAWAVANIGANLILGLVAAWGGFALGRVMNAGA